MNEVPIQRLHELFELTADGRLLRVKHGPGRHPGRPVGTLETNGYLRMKVDGVRLRVHRVIYAMANGAWAVGEVDHIDGNRQNNRPENLRDVTRSENAQNQRKAKANNRTGVLGAAISGNRWVAKIKTAGRVRHLGHFATPEAAHQAYVAAKREMHSTCTI